MYGMVPGDRRRRFREIVAQRYEETDGDWQMARPLIEQDLEGCGSVLFWLTLISVLMSIAHSAFQLWQDSKVLKPTSTVLAGEPFRI